MEDKNGVSSLVFAFENGHNDVVNMLLEHKVNIDASGTSEHPGDQLGGAY
jgi:ankyrin repeat protein